MAAGREYKAVGSQTDRVHTSSHGHSIFLTYSPDGTNICCSRGGEFEGKRSV